MADPPCWSKQKKGKVFLQIEEFRVIASPIFMSNSSPPNKSPNSNQPYMKIRIHRFVIFAAIAITSIGRLSASPLYSASPSAVTPSTLAQAVTPDVTVQSTTSPTASQVQSTTPPALGSAQLSVEDQLDLVTTAIWHGGVKFWSFEPNVFVTSTLAASKPTDETTNRYQDAELLTQNGGVLNLLFSKSSVDVDKYKEFAQSSIGSTSLVGRSDFSDRYYINHIDDIVTKDTAECYILNGIGLKMLDRNLSGTSGSAGSTTSSNNPANYGLGAMGYLGLGVDGALIPTNQKDPSGNYRAELFVQGSWSDSVSMKALYPTVAHINDFVPSLGANFQIVISNRINVNIQAGRSLGANNKYIDKVLLIGVTLTRP